MLLNISKIFTTATLCVLLLLYWAGKSPIAPCGKKTRDLLITNAAIVDAANNTVHYSQTLHIESGIIRAVEPTARFTEPADIPTINAKGKFIIPGLWDMHTHLTLRTFEHSVIPVTMTQGVFYVREMIGDCFGKDCRRYRSAEEVKKLQQDLASGELLGPRIMSFGSFVVSGPQGFDGNSGDLKKWPFIAPQNKQDVAELIRYAQDKEYSFIKTYDSVPKAVYHSIVSTATDAGIPVEGHIPKAVSLAEAIDAGQKTVEHARYPLLGCSKATQAFHQAYQDYLANIREDRVSVSKWYSELLQDEDTPTCNQLLSKWAKSETYYVPTHITREAEFLVHHREFIEDPRIKYIPEPAIKKVWEDEAAGYQEKFSKNPEAESDYRAFYEKGLELTGRAHTAGVKIMAGTDVGDILVYPGFSLHDELGKLVAAGLSPADALRAATLVPAGFYGLDTLLGSVDVGKQADLLFLEANPLEDITNTKKIAAILFKERFYDKSDLEKILENAVNRTSGFGFYLHSGWELLLTMLKY